MRIAIFIAFATLLAHGRAYAVSPPGPPLVFFDWDDATLLPETKKHLEQALYPMLQNLKYELERGEATGLTVSGHADRSGSEEYNLRLSLRRAEAVRNVILAQGVPSTLIHVEAHGEKRLLVETDDGKREPQNRFVLVNWRSRDEVSR